MKITTLLVGFLLLCAFSRGVPVPAPSVVPSPTPSPVASVVPVSGPHPRVQVLGTVGATASEKARVLAAGELVGKVLGSVCFKARVLGDKYDSVGTLTQEQVYQAMSTLVLLTVEIFDGSWWENRISKTVAYEGTGGQIRLNRYFLGSSVEIGATMVHEGFGHYLGFSHPQGVGTGQPYGAARAFEACAKLMGLSN